MTETKFNLQATLEALDMHIANLCTGWHPEVPPEIEAQVAILRDLRERLAGAKEAMQSNSNGIYLCELGNGNVLIIKVEEK